MTGVEFSPGTVDINLEENNPGRISSSNHAEFEEYSLTKTGIDFLENNEELRMNVTSVPGENISGIVRRGGTTDKSAFFLKRAQSNLSKHDELGDVLTEIERGDK
ncbi:hypothetical protein GS429_16790 [Natronorubrum sp. JWXQ-INN-674]|uniref:Uncharacterized protein n=1 Tax=Natronorubrum halalkaliphilum TaxID=2691917 RepID=A0A6B0VRU1_9EURY|nr:hypothetical protein [Natronorubrum halalkaliphilum]MXV63686.1 hypothetical protein [Natronorubrum halalkaliphilum]